MYDEDLAEIYDAIYVQGRGKDYAADVASLTALIRKHKPDAGSLLDVACGIGGAPGRFSARFRSR